MNWGFFFLYFSNPEACEGSAYSHPKWGSRLPPYLFCALLEKLGFSPYFPAKKSLPLTLLEAATAQSPQFPSPSPSANHPCNALLDRHHLQEVPVHGNIMAPDLIKIKYPTPTGASLSFRVVSIIIK